MGKSMILASRGTLGKALGGLLGRLGCFFGRHLGRLGPIAQQFKALLDHLGGPTEHHSGEF
eukprot:5333670-Pyramimonas_sp.AAC.1